MKPHLNGAAHKEPTATEEILTGVLWRMQAPTGRLLTCVMHRTEGGYELRACYAGDDPMWSEEVDSEEAAVVLAAAWKDVVVGKGGFVDLDLLH